MISDSSEPGFRQPGNLLRYIQEKADDIEKVVIPQVPVLTVTTPHGKVLDLPEVGMVLHLVDNAIRVIHYADAEILLNDGILNRMRIPIEFYRGDDRGMVLDLLSTSQFTSVILAPLSLVMLWYLGRPSRPTAAETPARPRKPRFA